MKCHLTPTSMGWCKRTRVGEHAEKLEPSQVAGGNVKWCGCCGKVWQLPNDLPCGPTIPLLGMDPRELREGTQTGICTPVCTALWFTVAKRWKQPKGPWTDKWIHKMWYIHKMEQYPAFKRKFSRLLQPGWAPRTSCAVKQASHKRTNSAWFYIYEGLSVVRFSEAESRMVGNTDWGASVSWGQGLGRWGSPGYGWWRWWCSNVNLHLKPVKVYDKIHYKKKKKKPWVGNEEF